MKSQIVISGQISGNYRILSALHTYNDIENIGFNNSRIIFNTVGEATKTLRDAYKKLIRDEPEFKNGIKIDRSSKYLKYDASQAIITGIS